MFYALYQEKIFLENLTYWNVEEQEPYFSYIEASKKKKNLKNKTIPSIYYVSKSIDQVFYYHFFQNFIYKR